MLKRSMCESYKFGRKILISFYSAHRTIKRTGIYSIKTTMTEMETLPQQMIIMAKDTLH